MIAALATFLAGYGIPEKLVKPLILIVFAVLVFAAAYGLKCTYDSRLIKTHDATQAASAANADRSADNNAATSRVADQARSDAESTQIKEAINAAGPDPAARRAAYYKCVQLQQSARAHNQPPASC